MLNTTSLRLSAILLLSASALLANNVTGKWSGTVGNGKDSYPISFELHQSGIHITGTINVREDSTVDGFINGDEVRLDAKFGKDLVRFQLSLSDAQLRGTGWVAGSDGEKKDVATVSLTLAQPGKTTSGISGTWSGTAEIVEDGKVKHEAFTIHLDRNGSVVTGAMEADTGKSLPITTGTISGNDVVLTVSADDMSVRFELTVNGNEFTGTAVASRGTEKRYAKITAVKQG